MGLTSSATKPPRPEWVGDLRKQYWRENFGKSNHLYWQGVSIRKPAEDLFRYQEIIFEAQPNGILETGGAYGGSALFFCHMLDLIGAPGAALVVSVSTEWYGSGERTAHPRLREIKGSSTTLHVIRQVKMLLGLNRCLVSLDSDHSTTHVMNEMDAFKDLVGLGPYMVVEDTTVEDVPSHSHAYHECGPREALARWLPKHPEFEAEEGPKYLTCNQGGWLRRVTK